MDLPRTSSTFGASDDDDDDDDDDVNVADGGDIRRVVHRPGGAASARHHGPAVSVEVPQGRRHLRHLQGLQVLHGGVLPGDGGARGAEVHS